MIATLKGRVVMAALAVTAIGLAAVASVILFATQRGATETLQSDLKQVAQANATEISNWAVSKQLVVKSLMPAVAKEDLSNELAAARTAGDFDDVYVGYADKRATFFQKRQRAADYDPTKRGWYIGAAKANGPFISKPYVGAGSKKLTVTFADPVNANGTVGAVVAADVLMESVQKTLAAIKPTSSSLAFLEGADGTVIAHPNDEAVLKTVDQVFPGLTAGQIDRLSDSGTTGESSRDGREQTVLVTKVDGTPWRLVILVDTGEALASVTAARNAAIAMVVVALLLAGVALFVLLSRYMKSLDKVRDAMNEIASGDADLTKRLSVSGGREIEQIASAFNRFVDVIADILRQVKESSEAVLAGSTQLSGANQDLSARTERQAAALEQTSASTQTLSGTVSQNSRHTEDAAALATASIASAQKSKNTVVQVSHTMGEISKLAERITSISEAVNGIAAQTNILALNAAVESARAGTAGRGFAVVASEVRQLAHRTAESAKEISALASDAQHRVHAASSLVQDGVSATSEIAQSATQLSEILDRLAAAGIEQAAGLEEVRQALLDLDDVTQQNAALVEEAAAATDALAGQSVQLTRSVGAFRL